MWGVPTPTQLKERMNEPSQRGESCGAPVAKTPPVNRPGLLFGGLLTGLLLAGCGAAEPREADIYHDPLLRPSVVESEGADAQLLARLDDVQDAGTVQVGGAAVQVEAPYPAASGRVCRAVGERLACRASEGWEFVPVVLPTAGGGSEAAP